MQRIGASAGRQSSTRRRSNVTTAVALDRFGMQGPASSDGALLKDEGRMPSLDGAVAWLNSPPLTREALKGKVEIWVGRLAEGD